MRERGCDERVRKETVAGGLRRGDRGWKQLERDGAGQSSVARAVDVTETAAPEVLLDAVRPDDPRHGGQYT